MARRLTIIVRPTGQGNLTVEDAMRQVLDAFMLLDRTADEPVVWRLIEAKTSSPPFSVTAEAENDQAAEQQKLEYAAAWSDLKNGRVADAWADADSREIMLGLLARIQRGASIDISGITPQPIRVDQSEAAIAARVIVAEADAPDRTKHQMGSIEGTLRSVETYRGRPALKLVERKMRSEITCELSPDLAQDFQNQQTFDDVWRHRRVAIYGLIYYSKRGRILRVVATEAKKIDAREVPLEEIQDGEFTSGLSSFDYLSKLRDGDLD